MPTSRGYRTVDSNEDPDVPVVVNRALEDVNADVGELDGRSPQAHSAEGVAFALTDAGGRRSWLEVDEAGGPTEHARDLWGRGPSSGISTLGGVAFAVVDEADRMSWLQVAEDGGPTPAVEDMIREVAGTPAGLETVADRLGPVAAWSTVSGPWDPALALYNAHARNGYKWAAKLAQARAGTGTAHVSTFLDSRTYGAAATGVSSPKWLNSWPGRLRRLLDGHTGRASGTGIACPWDAIFTTPTDDPRYTWGSGVTSMTTYGVPGAQGYGPLGLSCARLDNSAGNGWIQFAPPAPVDRFVVYLVAEATSTGLATIRVDGADVGTVSLAPVASGGTLARRAGYAANQIVVDVAGLSLGVHTLRVVGAAGEITNVIAVEGGTGQGVRVSNLARSSTQMSHYLLNDANNRYGMPVHVDLARADLQVLMPISNDRTAVPSTFKEWVRTAIARQRAAGGETLLIAPCQPDYAALGSGTEANWTAIVGELYELADEEDVRLLDLTWAWTNYATMNALGMFGDAIHENNSGSELIAWAVYNAITKG